MKSLSKRKGFVVFISLIMLSTYCGIAPLLARENKSKKIKANDPLLNKPIKISYFSGQRTSVLYKAYIDRYFDSEGIGVELYTRNLDEDSFYIISKNHEITRKKMLTKYTEGKDTKFGTVRGTKIIEAIDKGKFEGGTSGESSFVYQVVRGSPVVAVAMLGHDVIDAPSRAIIMRKEVIINKPEDFKGKMLVSRRAGPGDVMFLREFIESIGLDSRNDVIVMEQMSLPKIRELLKKKAIDGFLGHFVESIGYIEKGDAYLYRRMDWMNPEISHALLVFRKDFVENHPDQVKKFIRAYMRRIKYEHSLSREERHKKADFGMQISQHYKGLSLPVFDYPPLVRIDLLKEVQRLLLKYGFIDEEVDLKEFINNDFVREVYEELK